MAATKGTQRTTRRGPQMIPALPATAGSWTDKVEPFFGRYSAVLALLLVAVTSARIVSTYSGLAITYDEPGRFACGLEYLSKHIYHFEAQHPPLARAMTALGPYLEGAKLVGGLPDQDHEGAEVIERTSDPDRTIALMRLGVVPFFWMACWVVYAWTARYWSKTIAVLALLCFTLMPPVLAHAGLATTDMALAATVAAAFFALLVWCESPTTPHAFLLGVTSASAALSKFTSLGYLPAAAIAAVALWYLRARPPLRKVIGLAKARLPSFGLAVGIGAFFVWAGYWFSFGTAPGWHYKLPAWEFFKGIQDAMTHNAHGHGSVYLLGELSDKGWWYFFPAAIALKTPLALLLAMIIGLVACCLRWRAPGEMSLLAFTIGIMVPAMTSPVNIGVRHVLPVFISLAMMSALGVAGLCRSIGYPRFAAILAGGLFVWAAISGAHAHPDYIAYFNEIASRSPESFLVDSDLDWGQGYKSASRLFRKLGVDHVAAKLNGGRYRPRLYPLPNMTEVDNFHPQVGWNVLGGTDLKHFQPPINGLQGLDYESLKRLTSERHAWFEAMEPTVRLDGLLLYYFPPGTGSPQ
jgi:hypothetical protein